MPRPAHTLMSWSGLYGPAGTPVEEWTFTLKAPEVIFAVPGDRDLLATALKDAYATNFVTSYRSSIRLTRTRVAQVGVDGRVTRDGNGAYNQADDLTVVPGTSTSSTAYPPQVALCFSLVTERAGPEGKGRFFMPAPVVPVDLDTLVIATAAAQVQVDRAADFLRDVNDALGLHATVNGGGAPKVSVVSSKGYVSQVNEVKMGRAYDTQTRRRGALLEGYVSGTAAVAF